ncbi:hypothetical protein [Candidatus Enterococcus ferrettii]|uniref:DUF697 domain-containing protein n=1 Tax=Candidatus Enterococcus ferrettii TaxID=2815324 RepID=A0ABV0EUW2_9ENTE|nr:hypothetical protein [Enterococcus sp. 665A]MBO1340403.1 hypothetical protein [Enterococcus sp. 665A]
MDRKQRKRTHLVIHTASSTAAAIGGGMAQLPISDAAALIPVQTAMIIALGKIFNKKIEDGAAKALATQFIAQQAGKMTARFVAGKIPVAGTIVNATTAAAITETYGWMIAKEFAEEVQALKKA